ncbi:MAG TPA: VIT1/CCC1 family protein [Tepidiformaceae bacterium]|nr:VIT1/CCC1 family protein [Tepidiformaceae bacterium]
MPTESPAANLKRYRENLRDEVDGVALYERLAAAEKDANLREVYTRLAASERKHQNLWESKIREAGGEVPSYGPSFRVRFLGWLARRFGTAAVSPIVTRMEMSATTMYDDQPEAVEALLPADERSHARLFREISRASGPRVEVDIARVEGRHRAGAGNALRAAVLGANDGLVSNFLLVTGVAGADPGRDFVVLAGVGGLLAGSISMALGEWISVRSSAEAFERQVEIEREELELMPEEEEEELFLIYRAKGLADNEARAMAKRILTNHSAALDTLTREELGMSAGEAGNAWVAAITSFLTFSAGAIIPVLPWLLVGGSAGLAVSAVLSALGLFATGAITTLFTGRRVLFSGSRMVLFGLAGAVVSYGAGLLLGAGTGI